MPIGTFLFLFSRSILLEEQEFRTVKADTRSTKVRYLVCFGRDFDIRVQHNVLAIASHRLQLAHREKLTALAFEHFLAFVELADILIVRVDDNLTISTVNNNRIATLDEGSNISKARDCRDLQCSRQDGHMACTATRIHHDGVHLTRLERHQETWNKLMGYKDNAFFVRHILQYRSGVVHRRHQAVIQVPEVCRLVTHGRRVDLFKLFDVGAKYDMYRPLRILVFFLDLVENSIHESRILQDHQVGCKNQAVLDASSGFRDLLNLGNFLGGLTDGLQEHLFFCSKAALRESFIDHRKFTVCNRKNRTHGKARGRWHTNEFNPLGLHFIGGLRYKISRVLR